jgi:hypothetical protein
VKANLQKDRPTVIGHVSAIIAALLFLRFYSCETNRIHYKFTYDSIINKGASNSDTKYQIKIDGKGVDYKEVANNMNGRILSIDFSKDNRFLEIIGTQMTS